MKKVRVWFSAMVASVSMMFCGCDASIGKLAQPTFESTPYAESALDFDIMKNSDYLSGLSDVLCTPDSNQTRDTSSDPYVLLYRIDQPYAVTEADVLKKIYPASVTKLVTAYVALKYCDTSETVKFSYKASHLNVSGAMVCGFMEGDSMSLYDLLAAMLIYSGNDCAIAVAEHVCGSVDSFVAKMNEEMEKLGASGTNFVNPHGLHNENHYTTAYDMYLVLNALYQNEEFLSIVKQASCTINYNDVNGVKKTKTFQNTNLFLTQDKSYPEDIHILGGKTGTTNAAGCCLALLFKTRNEEFYIAEVFGAASYDHLYEVMNRLMLQALSQ